MKLWHCRDARSLRPLWALEEMGLAYDLIVLPFPPRVYQKDYLALNPLGTVPYFVDGPVRMTESSAICHYLVEKYRCYEFGLRPEHDQYGAYLNWLYQSDATLTFPQTIYLRYSQLEPPERRLPQAAEDYRKWFMARLRMLDDHVSRHAYLCDHRFTIADITVGYALFLGENLGIAGDYQPQTRAYLARLKERPGFQAARRAQEAA
jgi:glutathione S-transferase